MKKTIIISIVFLGIFIFALGRFVYYGSLTRSCIYTEKSFPVPVGLEGKKLIVAKDAYAAIGQEDIDASCLTEFNKIDKQIINQESINNITIGRNYFTNRGLKIEKLKKGMEFTVVGVIASEKHGITNIEDSGPIHYLILKNDAGDLYKMFYGYVGLNKDDYFMALKDTSDLEKGEYQMLTLESFIDDNYLYDANIAYTGKTITQSDSYLKSTESQNKKMLDRLESGERMNIMVELWARDDAYHEIALSDDENERMTQVAKLQDSFLSKLPENLRPLIISKDSYHPYVNFEANPGLLIYLNDNKTEINIKSISELNILE